ncbi:unnamed protein product [Scytosiphon promiscuus]
MRSGVKLRLPGWRCTRSVCKVWLARKRYRRARVGRQQQVSGFLRPEEDSNLRGRRRLLAVQGRRAGSKVVWEAPNRAGDALRYAYGPRDRKRVSDREHVAGGRPAKGRSSANIHPSTG